MRLFITLFFSLLFFPAYSFNTTFSKLTEVNKCWTEQHDVDQSKLPAYTNISETEWIRLHLSLVESILKARNTEGLTETQRQNRYASLQHLHEYWQAGQFPINEQYSYRTPIFIDRHDNFCAVGYLLKASGNEHISRMIAANTNLAYVREMHYPELAAWAHDNGFTADELAWIQPGYPPKASCEKIGRGVDGEVKVLFADNNMLYVGGSFAQADSSIAAHNIAVVQDETTIDGISTGVYSWHAMGTGTDGPVNAIVKFGDKIFAGGSFNTAGGNVAANVAWWDGTGWHSAGCISGTVNALAVYNNELYAAGFFALCTTAAEVNFAKWDGSSWAGIPGLTGTINTMKVANGNLVLGGAFSRSGTAVNAVKWSSSTSFVNFSNVVKNEVKDFAVYHDTLYAACKRTDAMDSTTLILKTDGNSWVAAPPYPSFVDHLIPAFGTLSFNTLCAESSSLNIGGQFQVGLSIGTTLMNAYNTGDGDNFVNVDSAVNTMVLFRGNLVLGGKFRKGNVFWGYTNVNGIAMRKSNPTAVAEISEHSNISIYPQPVHAPGIFKVSNDINATRYALYDISGRRQIYGLLTAGSITLPDLVPGMYLIEIGNENGERAVRKLTIQ